MIEKGKNPPNLAGLAGFCEIGRCEGVRNSCETGLAITYI